MKKLFIVAAVAFCFSACTKENKIKSPSFDVTTDKVTYQLGDTVRFKFSGDADYLSLYTGEAGSKYEFKDRTRAEGKVTVTVNANLRNSLGVKSLSLLMLTELNPLRDSASVVNAPWIDISDRLNIPVASTNVTVPLGTADITDLAKPNKPVFFAWKLEAQNSAEFGPRWTVATMNLVNEVPDGTKTTIASVAQMGWKSVSVKNPAYAWILGGPSIYTNVIGKNTGDSENWAVSGPLYPDAITRDYPKAIKDIIAVMPNSYEYIYKQKGIYRIHFVALNSRNGESNSITKELEITVE